MPRLGPPRPIPPAGFPEAVALPLRLPRAGIPSRVALTADRHLASSPLSLVKAADTLRAPRLSLAGHGGPLRLTFLLDSPPGALLREDAALPAGPPAVSMRVAAPPSPLLVPGAMLGPLIGRLRRPPIQRVARSSPEGAEIAVARVHIVARVSVTMGRRPGTGLL